MIGSVPASIMRWIGGGIDPFHDNTAEAGKGFAQHVVGRGETAMQAAMGASKNNRDNKISKDRHKESMDAQKDQTKAMNSLSDNLSGSLMGKSSNGGGAESAPTEKPQGR